LTLTAVVPPKLPPAEIEVASSLEVASTVTLPLTVTSASFPMKASVTFVTTSTSTPAPTPAVPPTPREPASEKIEVVSAAETARPPPVTVVPTPTYAFVVCPIVLTTAEPATPAVLAPPPPIAISRTSSVCEALEVKPTVPAAPMVAFAACVSPSVSSSGIVAGSSAMPTYALTVVVLTRIAAEMPTPAELPKASPPAARSIPSASSDADTVTFPPAVTVVGDAAELST
jgi:hypothetical protein